MVSPETTARYGGKSHGGDESEEDLSTERLGEERSRHVVVRLAIDDDAVRRENGGRAESEKGRHDIEQPNDEHGPNDRNASRLRVWHCIKAHKNVRETSSAKDQGEAEGNQIERTPAICDRRAEL